MPAGRQRLSQIIVLVDKEDHHLSGVRQRLLGSNCIVDSVRLGELLADDTGIDRLESFGAKFGRMQDTVVDKLIPAVLREAGEPVVAAIDNLGRMERLELIASSDEWLEMRGLRNRLVHEYIDRPDDLAWALEKACGLAKQMHADYKAIRQYAVARLGVDVSENTA
jgi:hypothetical protein